MYKPSLILLPFKLTFVALLMLLAHAGAPAIAEETSAIAPLAERSLLLDLEQREGLLVAVGERGHLLLSEDTGDTWNQVQVPTRATLTAVFFLDRLHGWATGHDQVILRTEDGGHKWELVYENIEAQSPLLDIYFLDLNHGFAIGAYGQFLETFDSGMNWEERRISENDFHLNKIVSLGEALFIASEAGYIYRSDDQGANWVDLIPGYEGSFFGILPLDNSRLLLFGLRGNLFRSEDAGETWIEVETSTEASLTNGLLLKDGRLVITGLAGAILISADGGENFQLFQEPQRKGFCRLQQAVTGEIIAVGDFGVTTLSLDSISNKK